MPRATRLIWLPEAVADLKRLQDFLRPYSPAAARRAARRIKEAATQLHDHPALGRPVQDLPEFRDLLIPFGRGAYVLRYRLVEPMVVIVRIWHSREERDTPSE